MHRSCRLRASALSRSATGITMRPNICFSQSATILAAISKERRRAA